MKRPLPVLIDSLSPPIVFITQVDYDVDENKAIAEVRIKYFADDAQETAIVEREVVVHLLKKKILVLTAGSDRHDVHFAEVKIYPHEGKEYIRIVLNDTPYDNLGKLPKINRTEHRRG